MWFFNNLILTQEWGGLKSFELLKKNIPKNVPNEYESN